MDGAAYLRIGELSRRTGLAPERLRAWERRYGLLRPDRTGGGFRLYSVDDLRRVQTMQRHLRAGVSAAQAAALALGAPGREERAPPPHAEAALVASLDGFDDAAAQAALDGLLARYQLDTVLRDVVLPYLHELGERWACGEATVAQEHFASALLRGRLLGLARGWDQGLGPRAVLACPPDERHDLGLIVFGLALRNRGWRITYLGADTPVASIADAAAAVDPGLIVVAATAAERLAQVGPVLAALAVRWPVGIGGAAATPELAEQAGAQRLPADPVTEAERLTAGA